MPVQELLHRLTRSHRSRVARGHARSIRRLFAERLETRWVLSGLVGVAAGGQVPGELLIGFESGVESDAIEDFFQSHGLERGESLDINAAGHVELIQVPAEEALTQIRRLGQDPRIEYVEPNYIVSASAVPNDPRFDDLWGMHNTGQSGGIADADIDAPEAWDTFTGSTSTVVGVIDTGVDYTHADLARNVWINQLEIPAVVRGGLTDVDGDSLFTFYDLNDPVNSGSVSDLNSTGFIDGGDLLGDSRWSDGGDTDSNGYVDDLLGWDFVNNDNNPWDDHGHGTHVSGTIGAVGDNGVGVAGVNWTTQIMGLKFLDAFGFGSTSAAIQAVQYATMAGANLTNNSWGGGGFSSALEDAIAASGIANLLFIAAAGNDGVNNDFSPHYPSSYDLENIISVAATDQNDGLAWFSNFGANSVDVGAPGEGVLSTVPGNSYGTKDGTSMATPHVAGLAALAWSMQPTATNLEIRSAILEGADVIPALTGNTVTGGRINAVGTLQITNPHKGSVQLDRDAYALDATVTITVVDADLDIDSSQVDTASAEITSSTEAVAETVLLTETGNNTRVFTGTIQLATGAANSDGLLQVADGDLVTVAYEDADTGNGSAVVTDTAVVDAIPPLLSQVKATAASQRATITWTSDEMSDSVVRFGTDPGNLDRTATDSGLTLQHAIVLTGLTAETTYYFEVTSADAAGNSTTDPGHSFTTLETAPLLLVDDDGGAALETHFMTALDANGYIYDVWDISAVATAPTSAELSAYLAVIWNTGADYLSPTAGLTASEEAGIRGYLDGGGNLFLSGQDVFYNSVSPAFASNYLHVAGVGQDDVVFRALGVSGDPIGDGMNLPLAVPGEYEANYADTLQPDAQAAGVFFATDTLYSPLYPYSAVRYPANGPSPFKTVFFAFPFEAISATAADPNNQAEVMARALTWLGINAPGVPGITVHPVTGLQTSEDGDTDTFTVRLNTQPEANVSIFISTDRPAEGLVSTGLSTPTESLELTFTPVNWSDAQTVIVTGEDDTVMDGHANYTIVTSPATGDVDYVGMNPPDVAVVNRDNDNPETLVMESGIVQDVGSEWVLVDLENTYTSMVVVASANYDHNRPAGVSRIRNAAGNQFEIRVDSTNGDAVSNLDVHYVVIEEGFYTTEQHGVTLEAYTFTSMVTDHSGSWAAQPRFYTNAYTQPVVLSQVMSYLDPQWSVAWTRSESSATNPPDNTLRVGKHVGEDSVTTRADETIGYIVVEAGTGSMAGLGFTAGLGSDSVRGMDDAPPYTYTLSGLASPATAIVSQAAMDGGDGGWAVLYGAHPVDANGLKLVIDEDQNDSERSHPTEQVAYLVFEGEPNPSPLLDLDANNSSGAPGGDYFGSFAAAGNPVSAADADALLLDHDSAQLVSLRVTITNALDTTDEFLSANVAGTAISVAYDAATATLDLSGSDTVAHYQQVLRSVEYGNSALGPTGSGRTITFVANDGTHDSNVAVTTLAFTGVNQPPVAHAGGPYWIRPGWSVFVDASNSFDPDNGPGPLTYGWDLNQDGTIDVSQQSAHVSWATLESLGFTPDDTFTITVQVSDGVSTSEATSTIEVAPNQAPVAHAGGPYWIRPGWSVFVDATNSSDPDLWPGPLTYAWDLDNDGAFDDLGQASAHISWATLENLGYGPDNIYTIKVQVSDGAATHEATSTIEVAPNQAPVANAGGSHWIRPGWSVYVDGSNSYDPDLWPGPLTYAWDLDNDGAFDELSQAAAHISWTTLESYGFGPGMTRTITLQVSDGDVTDEASTTIEVAANLAPVANAGGAHWIRPGWSVYVDGSNSYDPDNGPGPLTYAWDLDDDGAFDDLHQASAHISWATLESYGYLPGVTHTIALEVSDGAATHVANTTIEVAANQAPVANPGGPYSIESGWSLYVDGSSSYDPDNGPQPLTYAWDLDSDGAFDDLNQASAHIAWETLQGYGFQPGNTYDISLRVFDGLNATSQTTTVNVAGTDAPVIRTGMVSNVGNAGWTSVSLDHTFSSMVVVASPNYDETFPAGVVRIRNATGSGFEVRVDATTNTTISGVTVHYVVAEEGVYTQSSHGVKMEAVKFAPNVTDGSGSWKGTTHSYANVYNQPVVVGQVMTYNDSRWSVFWSRSASSKANPPDGTMKIGKHVGEDPVRSRSAETIGYIVIEAGLGSIDGRGYRAGLGGDTVRGVTDSAPYQYNLSGLASASTAIVSQAAMDGGNGSWAMLYGAQPVTATALQLAVDEDQTDAERNHTAEQVAFWVFEEAPAGAASASAPLGALHAPQAGGEAEGLFVPLASPLTGQTVHIDTASGDGAGVDPSNRWLTTAVLSQLIDRALAEESERLRLMEQAQRSRWDQVLDELDDAISEDLAVSLHTIR